MNKKKRGRPPKEAAQLKSEPLLVRVEATEKEAFRHAAELAGLPLSSWVRERLRSIAAKELKSASLAVPFLAK